MVKRARVTHDTTASIKDVLKFGKRVIREAIKKSRAVVESGVDKR